MTDDPDAPTDIPFDSFPRRRRPHINPATRDEMIEDLAEGFIAAADELGIDPAEFADQMERGGSEYGDLSMYTLKETITDEFTHARIDDGHTQLYAHPSPVEGEGYFLVYTPLEWDSDADAWVPIDEGHFDTPDTLFTSSVIPDTADELHRNLKQESGGVFGPFESANPVCSVAEQIIEKYNPKPFNLLVRPTPKPDDAYVVEYQRLAYLPGNQEDPHDHGTFVPEHER